MTSPRYMSPKVSHSRIANHLWVNKAPNERNVSSSSSRKLNPITRQNLPKHKAPRPPRRYK